MEKIDYTKEIDLGIAKILVLCNLINRKTELCCFVNDTAHCRYIEVKLYKDVKSYAGTPIEFKLRYDDDNYRKDDKNRLEEANRCVEFLERTLKNKNIDYSMLHPIKEYVITQYEI
jgi:hypothetical protein